MNNDRLINLLPEEYLPEPEFKAFPIFAAVLIILSLLWVYMAYQKDVNKLAALDAQLAQIKSVIAQQQPRAIQFKKLQANARFVSSYMAVVPTMVLQAPDYWEIYNAIEEILPEDTWVQSVRFVNSGGRMPDLVLNCVSRGTGFTGPLDTVDAFVGTEEEPTRFRKIYIGGYQRADVGGGPGVQFVLRMKVNFPIPDLPELPDISAPAEVAEEAGPEE